MGGMRAEFSENVGKRPLGRPRMRRDDSIYIYIYIYICTSIYAVMLSVSYFIHA